MSSGGHSTCEGARTTDHGDDRPRGISGNAGHTVYAYRQNRLTAGHGRRQSQNTTGNENYF